MTHPPPPPFPQQPTPSEPFPVPWPPTGPGQQTTLERHTLLSGDVMELGERLKAGDPDEALHVADQARRDLDALYMAIEGELVMREMTAAAS